MRARASIILAIIAATAVVVPAAAQDGAPAAPPAGRYQLTPGADSSFVRLDTRTGAVSHCLPQKSGVWHCDPIMDSGLADRITALSGKVDRLATDLGDLSQRVDGLAAGAGAPAPAAASERTAGRPEGFAQTAVYRLLEMIRTLKHGRADRI